MEHQIAYTVIASFTYGSVAEEWLDWLKTTHIAEVIACGAASAEIVRLDHDDTPGARQTYEVRYKFDSRGIFEEYLEQHAPRLRADSRERFPPDSLIHYQRTVGEIVA